MSDQQPTNNNALPNKAAKTGRTNTPWLLLVAVLIIAALVFAQYRIEILLRNHSALEQQLQETVRVQEETRDGGAPILHAVP